MHTPTVTILCACAVVDEGMEEGVRAGSQGQTQAALEGQVRDGQMKEGTAGGGQQRWAGENTTHSGNCVWLC